MSTITSPVLTADFLSKENLRRIHDYMPSLSNRPDGQVDLGALLNTLGDQINTLASEVDAILDLVAAENTDAQIQVPLLAGLEDAGTWAKAITSAGVRTVTRTGAAATESFWLEAPVVARTTASKGFKATGIRMVYSVATADATDIRVEVYKRIAAADNVAPAAPTLLGGDQDAEYDTEHNTAVKRGDDTAAPELHTLTMTLPTPAYLLTEEQLLIRVVIVDPGTSVLVLTDVILLGSETQVDIT